MTFGISASLTSVLALGSDSFVAGTVMGTWVSRRERMRLAAAFGAWDAAAALLGSFCQPRPMTAIATWAICGLVFSRSISSERRWLYGIPVLLSLDNLFAGVTANAASGVSASMLGLSSFAMAFAGLLVGAGVRTAFHVICAGFSTPAFATARSNPNLKVRRPINGFRRQS